MKFELTQSERGSPLWIRLEAHFEAELARKRVGNDRKQPEVDTNHLRGEIAQLKAFLALGKKDVAAG